jgi:Xaa-Pro aminopeptidase
MSRDTRLVALRERLAEQNSDALVLTDVVNIAYCTGFLGVFDDEPAHVALISATRAILFTDSRYYEALQHAAAGSRWQVRLVSGWLIPGVAEELASISARRIQLEASMPHSRFRAFSDAVDAEVVEAIGWVETLRAVKNTEEIAAVDAAQTLTDRAFDYLMEGVVRLGATERQIALALEFFMRREGSEGVAFAPIVASGPNSALPHAVPGERVLAAGDFVVLDFGARLRGYCADMTRTVVIGSASQRQREVYDVVLAANAAAEAAVRPGVVGRDIDAAARSVIAESGFADYFGHGLGHGVGREVHELPSVGPRSEVPVEAGAVITIEPGIYIPGFGGVRIENLAVVEGAGARVLTRSTTDLLEL